MITVKEEFLGSPKWLRAVELGGSDAIVMWLALKCYAASNPTDGFIPDDDIERLLGAPKAPRKALKALVECGRRNRDGSRASGLVDQVENGWQLHDYLEHAPSSEEVAERRRKAKERKDRWRDRNEPGTRSRTQAERVPERLGNASGTRSGTENGTGPHAGGGARVPSPAQPSQTTTTDPAVVVTLADRARKVLENPHDGQWSKPSKWPETVLVCDAWSFGMDLKLRDFADSDSDLRAILQAFADGYSVEQLVEAGRLAGSSPYFAKLDSPGPASFTAAVIRRLLTPGTARAAGAAADDTGGFGKADEWGTA